MNLSTHYLGFKLRTPLVVSASPLTEKIANVRRMEDAGASAIVFHSLFEEQIRRDHHELHYFLDQGTESYAESLSYFPPAEFKVGPEAYLEHIAQAKQAVQIPIIGSLNGTTFGGWMKYAQQIQQAGADALELNLYNVPGDADHAPDDIENEYLSIIASIKAQLNIPVAVKLSPFFTNFAHFARRVDRNGADALVLFNRFYQPDIELETLEISPNVLLRYADGDAPAHALDRASLRPYRREPCRHQRNSSCNRRSQDVDGWRRRDHVLLDSAEARYRTYQSDRTGDARLDGRAWLRVGRTTQGQHEPAKLPGPRRFRACAIHASSRHLPRSGRLTTRRMTLAPTG